MIVIECEIDFFFFLTCAVNMQGFVWKFFLCTIYKFAFLHNIFRQNLELVIIFAG